MDVLDEEVKEFQQRLEAILKEFFRTRKDRGLW
jgi:hypothetical protein